MALPNVTLALAAGAASLALAVHAGATPRVSGIDGPAVSVSAQGTRCAVEAAAADCSAINLLGGAALAPGTSHTTVVVARNTGRTPLHGLQLVAGRCRASGRPDAGLCSALRLRITTDRGRADTPLADVPLAALHRAPVQVTPPAAPGSAVTLRLTVTLDRTVPPDVRGASVSLPISWRAAR